MTVSQNGIDLIKSFEGFRPFAYQDTGGIWTIGYGTIQYHNGIAVKAGDHITDTDAEAELAYEIVGKTSLLASLDIPFNQNQFDALTSFIYNVGFGAFSRSTLLKLAREDVNDPLIRGQFLVWSYDNGKFIPGLKNRREKEANLYFASPTSL